jgi:hypothetical protein
VRLSPLGTAATIWPIVLVPDDRWWWAWSSQWNENWKGKPKYSETTCSTATLSNTDPTWPDIGSNPGRRGGKETTNRLRYGTDSNILYIFQDRNREILHGAVPALPLSVLRTTFVSARRIRKAFIHWHNLLYWLPQYQFKEIRHSVC